MSSEEDYIESNSDSSNDNTAIEEVPGPLKPWFWTYPAPPNPNWWWKKTDFPQNLFPAYHVENRLDEVLPDDKSYGDEHSGYTHIEDVEFRAHKNQGVKGNEYFGAIAKHVYGDSKYWATVKVQHLAFFSAVLRDEDHPRFALYTKLNAIKSKSRHGNLNLWQRLKIPYESQDAEILQVTADLYSLFIVLYEIEVKKNDKGRTIPITKDLPDSPPKVASVKIRGNYNATHVLLRYIDGATFQPLIPQSMPASEFVFPPVTWQNTQGKLGVGEPESQFASDRFHTWRLQTTGDAVPEQLFPPPTPAQPDFVFKIDPSSPLFTRKEYEQVTGYTE